MITFFSYFFPEAEKSKTPQSSSEPVYRQVELKNCIFQLSKGVSCGTLSHIAACLPTAGRLLSLCFRLFGGQAVCVSADRTSAQTFVNAV
jgi:hypothetical protein